MIKLLDRVLSFINYWWFRYLMITELYMVESWERVTIHVFLFAIFLAQWYFNCKVILPFTGNLLGIQPVDQHIASTLPRS
ncbi:uncharacterized protein LOC120897107 [Anopheles arabiensis]|uniref:AGAP006204-PA n=3 Tax=gambiae species complex TaxID=44542 RepID=A0NEP6_ANOGA|nr:uncharacterized protein LOC4576623 [Anopheles gambiae]XP_040157659.1 uncharacterized protein LOC120897107 [Anopheles arabiensis]XP_040221601.1 uncharacterized protein LOC120948870 [Anopheles coluzzii]XP_041770084.1 uncharacterized protein LOC121592569 [Anopheles merus]EAU76567.1 AGAP006204-PA [Anopheles gambiae str. PEST]